MIVHHVSVLFNTGKPVGDTVLYFGCRHKTEDFLYQEDIESYVEDGLLTLHTAFSRDQAHKIYVQNLMAENKEEVWKILENNGHIYICGYVYKCIVTIHQSALQVG